MPRLFAPFTLLRHLLLILFLSGLALIPLWIKLITDYQTSLATIQNELAGNMRLTHLKNLISAIPHHQSLTNQPTSSKELSPSEMREENQAIDQYFNRLLSTANQQMDNNNRLSIRENTRQMIRQWQEVKQMSSKTSSEETLPLYTQLTEQIHEEFVVLGNSHQLLADHLDPYQLIYASFIHLPRLQSLLYQNSYHLMDSIRNQAFNAVEAKYAFVDIQFILYHLSEVERLLKEASLSAEENGYSLNPHLIESFQNYAALIQQLDTIVNNQILESFNPEVKESLLDLGTEAIYTGSQLWNQMTDQIDEILIDRKNQLQIKFWAIFSLSLIASLGALILGLFTYLKSIKQIKMTQKAIERFTQEQTPQTLSISTQDEISNLGTAFNEMTNQLSKKTATFNQLLEGIQQLAKGNLSARLHFINNPEYDSIIYAFNQMAENFEKIIQRLQQLGMTLTHSAGQITISSKEQETIIIEQDATTREIAVAANEISFTAKELAHTMSEVSHGAEQTSHLASIGKSSLLSMEDIMRQMVEASTNIADKLAILNERATNITTVITTISKVSDQTNLLSLNASIEAEKAGEYGKSFAVIAREIRRLADQTALATFDIEKIVNEMMTAVSSSVMGVDDFTQEIRKGVDQAQVVSQQLATIIEQVQNFTLRIETVNQGMQAQSTGAEQINEALGQLSYTSQQTAESLHRSYPDIQKLNAAAKEIQTLTPYLKTKSSQGPS
jgi:methyl-accepting chemotaxis protein WspA